MNRERGQAMVEYVLIVAVLCGVLLTPFVPRPNQDPTSILMLFVESFDIYLNSFHFVITMPVP